MAECRVLNEGKLVGCPTVVPGLMEYRLGGTITCALFPISSFSTRCGRVRTEESDFYVHCGNGLGQNANWYVNRHGVDSLIGVHGNSHLSLLQNKCTNVAGILFIRPTARITLYCTPGQLRPFAISCVRNSSYSFHRN